MLPFATILQLAIFLAELAIGILGLAELTQESIFFCLAELAQELTILFLEPTFKKTGNEEEGMTEFNLVV